ncbi:hypothetical protein PCASD_04495 [Puccinia coronata f. sp. avenae]|uniref:Secreted protein n=1 Tax=Puccinia coronata f. sp. avenae TaxID=200324 RepID=A0A2N5TFC7_9BASI|nr:hypothetical protein PCASD_09718 [Puccinia coronata f. sp. avenae]PLW44361.1 hypothetical protein PCASD_04495 [Puccinia coronata f. sp. avenae]
MQADILSRLACLWCLVHQGHLVVVNFYWNITYATANPNGLFERTMIGVNHTWPPSFGLFKTHRSLKFINSLLWRFPQGPSEGGIYA